MSEVSDSGNFAELGRAIARVHERDYVPPRHDSGDEALEAGLAKIADIEPQPDPLVLRAVEIAQEGGGKRWIGRAIKRPGQLHRDLGVPEGQKIPEGKLRAAAKRKGKVGQRARLALQMRGFGR